MDEAGIEPASAEGPRADFLDVEFLSRPCHREKRPRRPAICISATVTDGADFSR